MSFSLFGSLESTGTLLDEPMTTDPAEYWNSVCPGISMSPYYWILLSVSILFAIATLGFFIRNMCLYTRLFGFSNRYLILGFIFALWSAVALAIPSPKIKDGEVPVLALAVGMIGCTQIPIYLLFVSILILLAMLIRVAAAMQAAPAAIWARSVRMLVGSAVLVFLVFILTTVISAALPHVDAKGSYDFIGFASPIMATTSVCFCVALLILIYMAITTFKALKLIILQDEFKLLVQRIRTAFIVVSTVFALRFLYQILSSIPAIGRLIQPDYIFNSNPDASAIFYCIFHLIADYLPLATSLFVFLPTGHSGRRARGENRNLI